MELVKRFSWLLVHALAALSLLACISTLIGAIAFKGFAKENDKELGLVWIFSFGVLTLSVGIIGFVSGSIIGFQTGTVIKNARVRYPIQWFLANLLSIGIGIGFLAWGCKVGYKLILNS